MYSPSNISDSYLEIALGAVDFYPILGWNLWIDVKESDILVINLFSKNESQKNYPHDFIGTKGGEDVKIEEIDNILNPNFTKLELSKDVFHMLHVECVALIERK